MWRNPESQPTAPSTSSPKVTANSSGPTGTTAHASWLSPTIRVRGEISGNEDLSVDGTRTRWPTSQTNPNAELLPRDEGPTSP
jgi:hypothetical protein